MMVKPWQYGVLILFDAVFCAVLITAFTLIRKFRGQSWTNAYRTSLRSFGVLFIFSAIGILTRMAGHHFFALVPVRVICLILAVVCWAVPVVWIIRIIRRVRRDVGDTASDKFLKLADNKWIPVSIVVAVVVTFLLTLS